MKKKLLYITIAEGIMRDILNGNLAADSQVSSVREMAVSRKVNPKTIQKAFSYLDEKNIFYTKPGEGRFVTGDENALSEIRRLLLEEEFTDFITTCKGYGLSNNEILGCLKSKLEEE